MKLQLAAADGKKALIQIYVTSECFDRFLIAPGKARPVDMVQYMLTFYEEAPNNVCFLCLDKGHHAIGCKYKQVARCKYDGQQHDPTKCANSKTPTCFRCKDSTTADGKPVDAKHHALANKCPYIMAAKDEALATLKKKALEKYNAKHV